MFTVYLIIAGLCTGLVVGYWYRKDKKAKDGTLDKDNIEGDEDEESEYGEEEGVTGDASVKEKAISILLSIPAVRYVRSFLRREPATEDEDLEGSDGQNDADAVRSPLAVPTRFDCYVAAQLAL